MWRVWCVGCVCTCGVVCVVLVVCVHVVLCVVLVVLWVVCVHVVLCVWCVVKLGMCSWSSSSCSFKKRQTAIHRAPTSHVVSTWLHGRCNKDLKRKPERPEHHATKRSLSCSLSFLFSFPFAFPFFFSINFLFLSSFSFSFSLAPSLTLALALVLSLFLLYSVLATKHYGKNRSTNTAANFVAFECDVAQGKCTAVGSLPSSSPLPPPFSPSPPLKKKERDLFITGIFPARNLFFITVLNKFRKIAAG